MNPRLRGALALAVLIACGLMGCAPPPDQALDKVVGSKIHSILLLQVPDPGLVVSTNDRILQLDADYSRQVSLGKELTSALRSELERRGFKVQVRDQLPRIVSEGGLTADVEYYYEEVETTADAILHVVLGGGYASGFMTYRPWVSVRARLLAGADKRQLYLQRLSYGHEIPGMMHLEAPRAHELRELDAVLKQRETVATRLQFGAQQVAATIASQLR